MSSTMMMERTAMGLPGLTLPGLGTHQGVGAPTGLTGTSGYLMVPRCHLKFEKCQGGMKIHCTCEDKMACSMMQNLCTMLQGGMCSCSVMLNGMTICTCNLTMGLCRCEMTDSGVTILCTSGDTKCCEMIQACCDCLSTMLNAGGTCCLLMNNTPLACGLSEAALASPKSASKK
jgi:hypothetical protein